MTICKSKFQTSITFAVVLLINRNFKDLFKSTCCSKLQIIKTVSPIKFEFFKKLIFNLRLFWVYGHAAWYGLENSVQLWSLSIHLFLHVTAFYLYHLAFGVILLRFLDLTPDFQSRISLLFLLCIKSITSVSYLKFYRNRHELFKKSDLRYCMSCLRILFLILNAVSVFFFSQTEP